MPKSVSGRLRLLDATLDFRAGRDPHERLEVRMAALAKSIFRETASWASAEFLEALLADYPNPDFQVRLWDGNAWGAVEQPRFTLVLKHKGALRAMFSRPSELTLGETYIYDDFDIEGDIEAAFQLADYLLEHEHRHSLGKTLDLANRLRTLPVNNRAHKNRRPTNFNGSVHSRNSWKMPMALEPPQTQATTATGRRPSTSCSCARVSRPMTAWKSRTMRGKGSGPTTEPIM